MAKAILALADGRIFHGDAFGAAGNTVGEVCFNTSLTGYQEILTDPSYTDQIITFTYPHIGNVGVNAADMESESVSVRGRSEEHTSELQSHHDLVCRLLLEKTKESIMP